MKSDSRLNTLVAKWRTMAALSTLSILCWGCTINPKHMVPKAAVSSSGWKVGRSLQVMDVTGEKPSFFGGAVTIKNAEFKEALVKTLQNSGLFSDVSTNHGDLKLYATILVEKQVDAAMTIQYTADMAISYKFLDQNSNVVFSTTFETEYSSMAFSGATRTLHAHEGSARQNLASLLNAIQNQWPRN